MIVIGADTHKRTHALAAIDADTDSCSASERFPPPSRDTSMGCAGRTGSARTLFGRLRIAGTYPSALSAHSSARASVSCVLRRS